MNTLRSAFLWAFMFLTIVLMGPVHICCALFVDRTGGLSYRIATQYLRCGLFYIGMKIRVEGGSATVLADAPHIHGVAPCQVGRVVACRIGVGHFDNGSTVQFDVVGGQTAHGAESGDDDIVRVGHDGQRYRFVVIAAIFECGI